MNKKPLPYCRAICYSGYRDGQSPESGEIPTYEQVKQDLLILQDDWQSLRLYAIDAHTEAVLRSGYTQRKNVFRCDVRCLYNSGSKQ